MQKIVVINAHVVKNCQTGLGFIVLREAALSAMPQFHLQNLNMEGTVDIDVILFNAMSE